MTKKSSTSEVETSVNSEQVDDNILAQDYAKVLMPENHTETEEHLGVLVTFKPLPIGKAKRIRAAVTPFTDIAAQLQQGNKEFTSEIEDQAVESIIVVGVMLVEHYKMFPHITNTLEFLEEEHVFDDIVALVCTQAALDGANSFLLKELRLLLISTLAGQEAVNLAMSQLGGI